MGEVPTFDFIAGRVRGAVQAKDARVVWEDGVLYLVTSRTDVTSYPASQPRRMGGLWQSTLSDGRAVSFIRPGCGACLRRITAALSPMTLEEIRAAVAVDA